MNCYDQILDKYESLSKQNKKVADYIIFNIDDVIFFPISKLASTIDVSNATIVRFAQNLGYLGFNEFRDSLFEYQKKYLSPGQRIKQSIEEFKDESFTYENSVKREIDFLEKSISSISHETFLGSIKSMCNAKTIYIFGSGPNEMLAYHLHFRLRRYKCRTQLVNSPGKEIAEYLLLLNSKDIAVIYNFAKPNEETLRLVTLLREKDVPIILITDILTPPMIKQIDFLLCAERGVVGTFPSPVVPMAITNALIIGYAEELKEQALDGLEELGNLRKSYLQISDKKTKHHEE